MGNRDREKSGFIALLLSLPHPTHHTRRNESANRLAIHWSVFTGLTHFSRRSRHSTSSARAKKAQPHQAVYL